MSKNEAKIFFFQKKIQMADSKKLSFSIPPILNIFFQKFHGLVLGLVELIDTKDTQMFTTHSFTNSMIRQDSKPDSFDQSRAREDYVYQGNISEVYNKAFLHIL